ncbi:MAG: hypothetical protein JNM99_20690 [Verrucomicrobiaceae bacterium]|nr:hypothetical protein [Verrucomicrobiaceae bacterium]
MDDAFITADQEFAVPSLLGDSRLATTAIRRVNKANASGAQSHHRNPKPSATRDLITKHCASISVMRMAWL